MHFLSIDFNNNVWGIIMVNYYCDRCGFTTMRKSTIKNHLLRKFKCEVKLKNVTIDFVYSKYFKNIDVLEDTVLTVLHRIAQFCTVLHSCAPKLITMVYYKMKKATNCKIKIVLQLIKT